MTTVEVKVKPGSDQTMMERLITIRKAGAASGAKGLEISISGVLATVRLRDGDAAAFEERLRSLQPGGWRIRRIP
jgi:hypothetical protein